MDSEAKKLLKSKAWAIDAPSNRAEINDPNISPQIDRAQGWGSSFSQQGGDLPDRRHFNQILCETISAALLIKEGVPQWDAEIDYPVHAITNVEGSLWRAKVATGPTIGNEINPKTENQNVWEQTGQSRKTPDAPEFFQGSTPEIQTIVAQWKSGKDNGAKITSWHFQYTSADEDWPSSKPETLQYPYKKITGLSSGENYKVRARGVNDIGNGEWGESVVGSTGFTATGTSPGGGNLLSLLATAGDAKVDLSWQNPGDGGYSIQRYNIEWVESEKPWSESTTTNTTSTTHELISLTNGQEYRFRVQAVNQIGEGDWSNIALATPVAATVSIYNPTLLAPLLSVQSTTKISAQANETPSTTGRTAGVEDYNWTIRKQGHSEWSAIQKTTTRELVFENLESATNYEVRYSVTTSLGTTDNSPSSSATTMSTSTPVVIKEQPVPLAPRAEHQSDARGAVLNARHESAANGYSLYSIESTQWQYRKSGSATWITFDGTKRDETIPYPTIDVDSYDYQFRFRYKTENGFTGFSKIATLNRKVGVPTIYGLRAELAWHKPKTNSRKTLISWGIYSNGSAVTQMQTQLISHRHGPGKINLSSRKTVSSYIINNYSKQYPTDNWTFKVRARNSAGWGPWESLEFIG